MICFLGCRANSCSVGVERLFLAFRREGVKVLLAKAASKPTPPTFFSLDSLEKLPSLKRRLSKAPKADRNVFPSPKCGPRPSMFRTSSGLWLSDILYNQFCVLLDTSMRSTNWSTISVLSVHPVSRPPFSFFLYEAATFAACAPLLSLCSFLPGV